MLRKFILIFLILLAFKFICGCSTNKVAHGNQPAQKQENRKEPITRAFCHVLEWRTTLLTISRDDILTDCRMIACTGQTPGFIILRCMELNTAIPNS